MATVSQMTNPQVDGPAEPSSPIPIAGPIKHRRRSKFLHSIQRISSSQSLAGLSLKRPSSAPYGSRDTISSLSLASPTSPRLLDGSYSSQSSGSGYATSATAATTPGADVPWLDTSCGRSPVRRAESGLSRPGSSPLSQSLPLNGTSIAAVQEQTTALPSPEIPHILEDYFSQPVAPPKPVRRKIDFWGDMPHEIQLHILAHLELKQLVRVSRVSQAFHKMCFDGQLWQTFDASGFYKQIPAETLTKIVVIAGPFIKDLNLRGCVQVEYAKQAETVVSACQNLIQATLEGCRNFQRPMLHTLVKNNGRLTNLNVAGLNAVTNDTCRLIAQSCPALEMLNVSWCTRADTRGLLHVARTCSNLRDLRASELSGFRNLEFAQALFEADKLERLVLGGCTDLNDQALQTILYGTDPEIDILTDIAIVPPRRLRHLDFSRCTTLTDAGVRLIADYVPDLEGLQLTNCPALTNDALIGILSRCKQLTHLDLEGVIELTNPFLHDHLAKAPCAPILKHLSVTDCERIGDTGILAVIRACTSLSNIEMDNTRISDLVLAEAASMVRSRSPYITSGRPHVGLRLVMFDCQNVTWTGIREVLSRNTEPQKPATHSSRHDNTTPSYPSEVIALHCFYKWQRTVDEHSKRVLRGDLASATRLERKWAEFMVANEEAGMEGAGARRRRRRARETQMMHADEEGGLGMAGLGRRRRARSNGCTLM